jgi:Gram-negative bacterial TonB protein C-terminal/GldM third domain
VQNKPKSVSIYQKVFKKKKLLISFIKSQTMNFRLLVSILFIGMPFVVSAQNENQKDTLIVFSNNSTKIGIFEKVDIAASFSGGDLEWRRFLERNLRGDVAAENGAPSGIYTVVMQFVVDKDGNISDIKPLTQFGYGMEEEVVRILKKSPKWSPAMQNGKPVKAYRKQPITFMIETDGFQIISDEPYVLYSGITNHINITAYKVKPDDLEVTISLGTIIPGAGGNYTVRVSKPGRVIIQLFNKKHKEIGEASFEVKEKNRPVTIPTLKG